MSWCDGTTTEQDGCSLFRFPGRDAAYHDFRIFVMDHVAVRTDMSRHVVQWRDADNQWMAAMGTEFHGHVTRSYAGTG